MKRVIIAIMAVLALTVGLSACEETDSARAQDEATSEAMLTDFQKNQPVPRARYSQKRQNMIEVQAAQQTGLSTTSFFFLEGLGVVSSCPSIGYPIATTDQLTNPMQIAEWGGNGGGPAILPQIEPNGVFTGNSTGTYVMCINGAGEAYPQYWEGYVMVITGQATAGENGQVGLVGSPSGEFSAGE